MAMSCDLFHSIFGKGMSQIVDLFLVSSPVDLNEQRLMDKVFRVDSIERLAKLVKSKNIEPSLKYSAYNQLSVVTVDGELAKLFRQDVGEDMLITELEKFADEKALTPEEKEAVGSICDIVRQMCQTDPSLMSELSKNLPFLITLVKLVEHTALTPSQHRRVTAMLYLLVLSDSLQIDKSGILFCSGTISKKLQLPFCVEESEENKPLDKSYKREDDILEHEIARRSMRLSWNCKDDIDSAGDLVLTEEDIKFAQQLSLEEDVKEIERVFDQASDHYSFEKGIIKANILLRVYPKDFTLHFTSTSDFIKTLTRFFQTKPNQIKDERLLIKILEFSVNMINLVPEHSFSLYIQDQLSDINCPLYDYISFQVHLATREEAATKRIIVNFVSKLALKTVNDKTFNLIFVSIVKRFTTKNKTNSNNDHFYDLPLYQLLTKTLAKITSDTGSPLSIEVISNWFQIIPELVAIIISFYHGASQSYMGKSVIGNSAISILNLINQIKHESWESSVLNNSNVIWVSYLMKFRCETIRLCSMGILSSLADTDAGFEIIASTFGSSLYEMLLTIILDDHESSLIRSITLDTINKSVRMAQKGTFLQRNVSNSISEQYTLLGLFHVMERMRFYEGMYHSLGNFSFNGVPEDISVAPVTSVFVKSFNEFSITLLQFYQQDTLINLSSFNFSNILVQIINPSLINITDGVSKKYLIQQAATTGKGSDSVLLC